ncbi:hypothetical protein E4U60_002223 [Claviceps pazoutovae]|uniref:3-beta hydroxysteroid dehydrogenase/isomerase domain-containing protein n=1 Tax=Claviceps pazoutovae TaxID=1649127 RepID=A0A9P7SK19_9HYPO|nr:hypothetical protein E4U60_002223 [Claviceps pazoutovae]
MLPLPLLAFLVAAAAAAAAAAALLFIVRLNRLMLRTPPKVLPYLKEPLTEEAAREAYARVKEKGLDFRSRHPGVLERRYIIVGGSGLVGCQIALDLLDGGTPVEAIRLIDLRRPIREEFSQSGRAGDVAFVQADVTSETSTTAAFEAPWPSSTAHLPLTVFHTAAVIRPYERHELLYHRCSRVNVLGTATALSCAQRAGADIFIFTSSSQAASRSVGWSDTWTGASPRNWAQVLDETDATHSPRQQMKHAEYASNYARSKLEAEQLVCAANSPRFRTGCIRPGNGIYGHVQDAIFGRMLRAERVPTFAAPWVQSWVHVQNVSLAHMLLQKELVGPHAEGIAGRPFVVTDNGPSMLRFEDLYTLMRATSSTRLIIDYPPPVVIWMAAHVVEWYCVMLARWPWLSSLLGLREPGELLIWCQPATIDSSATQMARDDVARKTPEEGGLGYRGCCSTLEGLCDFMREWNEAALKGIQ